MPSFGAPESERLAELARYDVPSPSSEPELDSVAEAAARLFGVPAAFIAFLDSGRHWVKASHGTPLGQPRAASLCQHVLEAPGTLLVSDLSDDARFADHPLVAGLPGLRFYAGVPLVSPRGYVLGALAVLDTRAGRSDEGRVAGLTVLADLAMRHIDRRRMAPRDPRETEVRLERSLAALRLSEERYRLVARATNDAVWDWDMISGRVEWNEGIATAFRYRKGEVRPHIDWWRERIVPEDRERVRSSVEKVIAGGDEAWSCEYRFAYGDGSWAEVSDRGFVLRDDKGAPVRMVGSMLDVTTRNRLQARVRQADRLASVGTLASGVAHEINNPLSFVVANVAFALGAIDRFLGAPGGSTEELAEAQPALTDAARGADRVRKIVQDLRIFARGNDDRREALDLNRVLDASIEITKNTVRHAARLVTRIETLPAVLANEAQLAQAFINLLINAAEAIGVGQADKNRIELRAFTGENGTAVVEITDSGPGIPKDVLPHVFDPFFTTKPIGGGSGLGLAICHGIIEALNGRIEIASEVGQGTTVRIILPGAPRVRDSSSLDPVGETAPAQRRQLLIIDDEVQVLSALRRLLQREHDVEVESEGRAALARLEKGERFDLILCDLMMPRMSGVDFLAAVRKVRPELVPRIVFMTGGAFTDEARAFLREVHNPFLDKPIDPERLRALVREVVNRARPTRQ